MNFIEYLIYIDLGIAILSFITNFIYYIDKQKYKERALKIEKNIEETKITEKENNDLRLFKDEAFNHIIEYIIISFIPGLNIFLVYLNIHHIFFLRKEKHDKK